MTLSVSWTAAHARRLTRQFLGSPAAGSAPPSISADLARTAGAMLGAHAQVLSAAELSLCLRHAGATRADVRAALWEAGTLTKTYGPRGTVHLLPTAELPLWTGALSALPMGRSPHPEGVRLTGKQTDEVVAAVADALDGACLTADELTEAVVARTGPWAGELTVPAFQGRWPRWRQALHTAAHRGALCFGPNRGRKVTYTRPRGVVPEPGDAALAELVRRYLHAYGPATPQSFAKWLAVSPSWAVSLFGSLGGRIEEVDFEGERAWVAAGDTEFDGGAVDGVWLLPYFDAFGIAAYPRERLFAGAARERALAGGQAGNFPLLLVADAVAGVWHQRRSGRRIAVTVEPLRPLSAGRSRELEGRVRRVGEALEGAAELTVGEVTVGPHA
ncbi:winged helix DNA-binding domain-containing protein [Streptomyces cavernicola]|uniref:Winged helix DNA-binding domain-containing protein n=1 Tax=Streptomyces cavernicola TaxID=3043613 RepID=A0ABT6SIT0_9ACTN|nr:winged helix DNA-binding domain-containing protein [Streptomyces sp. B-S-A6]MDI3408095.1 winged helix DNA-binding domain-containing protein [Streptomyces sp. B-S-A6]